MSLEMASDPFSSKNVLKLPVMVDILGETWHGFRLDDRLESQSLHLADVEKVGLPALTPSTLGLSFDAISVEAIDGTECTTSYKDLDDPERTDKLNPVSSDDLWKFAGSSEAVSKNFLASWDRFTDNETKEPNAKLFSEAGPLLTDAFNAHFRQQSGCQPLRYAKTDQFQHALINLLLGQSSAFFEWNHSSTSFRHCIDNYTLSGHSYEVTESICNLFCSSGALFRRISTQSQSSVNSAPTSSTIRSSIVDILHAIETDLVGRKPYTLSLVQLTQVARVYAEILTHLEELLPPLSASSSETIVLAETIHLLNRSWTSKTHLRMLMNRLASRILRPAISATAEQLGLVVTRFTGAGNQDWLLSELLPSRHGKWLETIECLSAVETHAPRINRLITQPMKIELVQGWMDLIAVQQIADELEQQVVESLSRGILLFGEARGAGLVPQTPTPVVTDPFATDFSIGSIHSSINISDEQESLTTAIAAVFEQPDTNISLDLSPLQRLEFSIAPFLQVQHQLSSYALLKTLFLEHDLVSHLDQLYAFQLLGNGLFATRLSRALFDADQHSAEGRRKTSLTAGLRLEDREVWPPATSELRLVLMGLLSESPTNRGSNNIAECMSFAIRELTDAELELCRNLQSVHALDFLRLTYTPSNPVLELVITPSVLDKYDRIFRFLLVLLRMHSLTRTLVASISLRSSSKPPPTYRKLCIKLHYFVSSLIDYALNAAIKVPWDSFAITARKIHGHISDGDYRESLNTAGSIAQFRQLHEDTLDDMLKSLLLKRKQAKAYDLLCKLFSLALGFASTAASPNIQEHQAFYKQYEETMRSLLSQIQTIVSSASELALKRLDCLLFKLNANDQHQADDG